MRKPKLLLAFLWIATFCAPALADLSADIRKLLSDRLLAKATVGVEVVRLTEQPGECQVLFEQNSRTLLVPASNMKILTTSAALHVLTPQFKFRTQLLKHGDDLVVWGDGDPTLGDAELMDRIGWTQTAVFDDWANQILNRRVQSIANIVVDDSVYDEQFLHPRWEKHQFSPSGAEVAGLNFNANIVDFTIQERRGGGSAWSTKPSTGYLRVVGNTCAPGRANKVLLGRTAGTNDFTIKGTVEGACIVSATVHDPALYSAGVLHDLLKARGIQVNGGVVRDRTTRQQYAAADAATREKAWQVLGICETPLPAVVNRCNKDSMNLYAESLCKRMGAAASSQGGSWAGGTQISGEFLRKLGVAENEFHLDDGSGLSRENAITVNALVRCLLHNYYSPSRSIFIDSLPIGGVDGTLRHRFDGQLRGRVFAKTGFIANVSALSGYLKARSGEWYAFSILMNDIPDLSNSSIKPIQEQVVEAIDNATAGM